MPLTGAVLPRLFREERREQKTEHKQIIVIFTKSGLDYLVILS